MLALSVVWLWTAAVTIQGEATCPGPEDVARALAPLLSASQQGAIDARAEILPSGPSVRVRLLHADGTLISEKQLAAEPSCKALAETAAVVLAAWAVQLQADTAYAFEIPASVEQPTDPPPLAVIAQPAPAPPARPWAITVGAGILASFQATTLAPALAIDVRARPATSSWGGRLAFMGTAAHEQSLAPGKATWRRMGAPLGIFRQQSWGHLRLDAGIDLTPALVFVQGRGYTQTHSSHAWDLGAGAGARLGLVLGRVEPWIEVGTTAWLLPQDIEVTGVAEQNRLPRIEASAGAGITVHFED